MAQHHISWREGEGGTSDIWMFLAGTSDAFFGLTRPIASQSWPVLSNVSGRNFLEPPEVGRHVRCNDFHGLYVLFNTAIKW